MLKTSVVTNTWKCDECGTEETAEVNPFFKIVVQLPSMPRTAVCEIDYCKTCIGTITAQPVVDYVAGFSEIP